MRLSNRPRYYRPRRGCSFRMIVIWLFVPVLIVIGVGIYENRDALRPMVDQVIGEAVNDANEAVATLQAGPPTATPDPTDRIQRARLAWNQGTYGEALIIYEDIIALVPNDVDTHYRYTLGLIMEGRVIEGIEAGERAVTANPFSSDAWAIRAMALNRAGRYQESLSSALRALELNGENARARAFLAETYLDLGQIGRAETEVARAIEADPDAFEPYFVRARIYGSRFNWDAMIADLQMAYDLSGGMTYIGLLLAAELLVERADRTFNDPQAGLSLLQEMNETNPNSPIILERLGRYYWTQGDVNQAADYLNRCIAANSAAFNCHFWMGRVQTANENFDLAAESFVQAVELGSINPQHYYWAGVSQQNLGNCVAARQYFDTGYEIAQSDARAAGVIGWPTFKRPCGRVLVALST